MKLLPEAPEQKGLAAPGNAVPGHGWVRWLVALALALILLVFFFGYLPRTRRRREIVAEAEREANSLPIANVTKVVRSPSLATLLLPGDVTPVAEVYIYARASGYVSKRYADIGDRVKAGQILAEVEAPDLDAQVVQGQASLAQAQQQLTQARAAAENAQTQEELARVTWERYSVLVTHGAVSRQEADAQQASYRAWQANVKLQTAAIATNEENVRAARANLDRLIALQSFEKVRAPFSGIITARNFDVGALVSGGGNALGLSSTPLGGTQISSAQGNAGASGSAPPNMSVPASNNPSAPQAGGGGSGGELYRVAQIDSLRVLVNVPQQNAATVRVGEPANVLVPEYAGRSFPGKVTRTSKSLDATARTMIAEVQVANHQELLLPGMYSQVEFANVRSNPPLLIPGESVMQTANGLEVAVLKDPAPQQLQELRNRPDYRDDEARQARSIHVQKIQVGRDYGPQVEVTAGLQGWEYVVVSPGDRIQENALVIPRAAPQAQGQGERDRGPSEQQAPGGLTAPSRPAANGGPQSKSSGATKGRRQ